MNKDSDSGRVAGDGPVVRSLKRIAIAVLLSLPGIGLAFVAKPLILGEGALLLGVLLAFGVPVCYLVSARPPATPGALPVQAGDRAEPADTADLRRPSGPGG